MNQHKIISNQSPLICTVNVNKRVPNREIGDGRKKTIPLIFAIDENWEKRMGRRQWKLWSKQQNQNQTVFSSIKWQINNCINNICLYHIRWHINIHNGEYRKKLSGVIWHGVWFLMYFIQILASMMSWKMQLLKIWNGPWPPNGVAQSLVVQK